MNDQLVRTLWFKGFSEDITMFGSSDRLHIRVADFTTEAIVNIVLNPDEMSTLLNWLKLFVKDVGFKDADGNNIDPTHEVKDIF